jgi:leucyl aminopeptidase
MSDRTKNPQRVGYWRLALAAALACFTSVAPAQDLSDAETQVWITIAVDGFEVLREAGFTFQDLPVVAVDEVEGVVLTRVTAGDLATISSLMHGAFKRCAGFTAHPSLQNANAAFARLAAKRTGAVERSGPYTINQALRVQGLVAAIEKPEILNTIERLSEDFNNRYHLHPSGTAASQWIHDQWKGYASGRSDATVELYEHASVNQPSVILTLEGVVHPEEVVVLGAHLDSVSFNGGGASNPDFLAPGADDDASGIAVLSEVVRIVMESDFVPQRTVQFIGYAAEEIGLVGSGDIANQYAEDGVDVVAVLQLDMTDYKGSNEDIGLLSDHTDDTLTDFVGQLIDTYQPNLQWTSTACGYSCSDHASWDSHGYPAAMSFEARVGEGNPQIHSTSDTVDFLNNNVDHAFKFTSLATAFLVEIAKGASVDVFDDGFESGTTDTRDTNNP